MKYYIKNGSPVGNCAMWWCPEGKGYTTNLKQAGQYTEAQARSICADRPGIDTMWPVDEINAIAEIHVDIQDLPRRNESEIA